MKNSFNPDNEKLKMEEFINSSRKITKQKRDAKRHKNNAISTLSLWTDTVRKYHPELPPMTMPVWAAKNISKKLNFSFDTEKQICFIEFVVSNWSLLMQSKFSGVKDKPVIPKAVFFLGFYETFLESYLSIENPGLVHVANPHSEKSKAEHLKTAEITLEKSQNEIRLEKENTELLRKIQELETVISRQVISDKTYKKTALPAAKKLITSKHKTINIKQSWD